MSLKINSFEEYQQQYQKSVENPEVFWGEIAETFQWRKKWDKTLEWEFKTPSIQWFVNGKLNITENCLDRHLATQANKTAIIWEPNNPNDKAVKITYKELHEKVNAFANVLKSNGAKKGDRICLYMPMVPELAIATLACARIGAIHSVVFAGFSAKALADRINDAKCNIVICSDESYRGSKTIPIKTVVDEALQQCTSVKVNIVLKRTGAAVPFNSSIDKWWHDEIIKVTADCPAEEMDAEDPLFVLYTSGSTGSPKGVVHTIGGYMVFTQYSFQNVFQYKPNDIFWCTADIGWITGHSYIVYGPLLAGATTVMFEGVPTWPDAGRFWEVIAKHKVNIFYTAPTAIRALQACDLSYVNQHDLSSLEILGSVGEPINDEAWEWYHEHIGKGKCPIVDTWWQTETGGIMISPLGDLTPLKPSYATYPLPGVQPCIVDADGKELTEMEAEGNLCIKFPWPSMIRTIYNDHERCKLTYFSAYENKYFTGDGCRRDADGRYRITGRVDDVINVSGHRMGTAEVEDALNAHGCVVETAVVGYPHDIKGQGIYAYVICAKEVDENELRNELLELITKEIGPIAKPDKIQVVKDLPKTRSGKIMRRILRKIAEDDTSNIGDTSTLLDPDVIEVIKKGKV